MLLTPKLIAFMFVGVVVGIIFGAIPGLSATMAIVLFLPVTFNMTVYEAFAMLVALYIGGVSGGLVSAILTNIPGSAMSIATTYDGNPMANSGHAQRALGIGIVFSFFGTVLSVLIMIVAAPSLASVAVKLGSYEFFPLTLFAVVLIASVSGKDIFKSLASLFLGLAFCMIGIAPVDGAFRYTFGITGLLQGVPLTPAVIGMFATSEILYPVVLTICVVASFAENRQMFDVWLLLVFGILGFIMSKFGLPRACFVMGLVLGANVETNLRRALQLSQGSFTSFFTRPVSCILLIITFAIVVRTIWTQVKSAKAAKEG